MGHGFPRVTWHNIEVLTIAKCDNCSPMHLGVFGRGTVRAEAEVSGEDAYVRRELETIMHRPRDQALCQEWKLRT